MKFTSLRYIDRIWLLIPVFLAFVLLNFTPLREGDTWWHIKVGEQILNNRSIPELDIYTFTAFGLPFYFTRSWLSDLILHVAENNAGLPGLVFLQAITAAVAIGVSMATGIHRGTMIKFAGIASLIGLLGIYPFSTARPVMFSFLCFSIILWVLYLYRYQERNRLWLLPVIMLFWINLNSAWLTGIFLIGLFILLTIIEALFKGYRLQEDRSLIFWSLLAALVILVNPQGPGIISDIFTATSNPVNQAFVSEWQPTSITVSFAWPFFLIIGILIVSLAISKNRLDFVELSLLLVFAGLSLRYQRMLPFFYLVVVPTLGFLFSGIKIPRADRSQIKRSTIDNGLGNKWIFVAFVVLLIFVAVVSVPQVQLSLLDKDDSTFLGDFFPDGAADYISMLNEDDIHLFNQPEWGGYLTWRLHPKTRVFIDGRVEQFPLEVWDDYYRVISVDSDWLGILRGYQVEYLILNKEAHQPLIASAMDLDISCPYEDEKSLICKIN